MICDCDPIDDRIRLVHHKWKAQRSQIRCGIQINDKQRDNKTENDARLQEDRRTASTTKTSFGNGGDSHEWSSVAG